MTHLNSYLHVTGIESQPLSDCRSDNGKVLATITFERDALPLGWSDQALVIVSGTVDNMRAYARTLGYLRDEIMLECERVEGMEREQMDEEVRQSQADVDEQWRDHPVGRD